MDPQFIARWLPRIKRLVVGVIVLLIIGGVTGWAAARRYPYAGPPQPIPFSHKLHVNMKGINCLFCHAYADRAPNPGMPSVEKCLLCHRVIIPEFRPIRILHEYAEKGQGVPWERVNVVPDHVHFNHQIHIANRVDCGRCHGNVKQMDRVHKVNRMDMGFCVDCHWAEEAPVDCGVCHH